MSDVATHLNQFAKVHVINRWLVPFTFIIKILITSDTCFQLLVFNPGDLYYLGVKINK